MNIYFDTEFTGLVPNTTLISIGCVAETGEKFYAEFTDYNKDLCDDWIKENVIKNLYLKKDPNSVSALISDELENYEVKGYSRQILKYFTEWLKWVSDKPFKKRERIQFVSDVCHYDFYLLCNLFGGAFSLPGNVCPWCHDICQDLIDPNDGDIKDGFDAFNFSREEACKFYNQGKLPEGNKHNALYDAEVIKMIYEGMRR